MRLRSPMEPPLSDLISLFWLAEEYAPPHPRERVLPTGTVELVVDLRDPAILVAGARSEFFVLDTSRPLTVLGVHFKPGGAFPFLGVPAGEVGDATVPLQALWGPAAGELLDRLLEARTAPDRFHLLAHALLAQATRPPARDPAVTFALRQFHHSDGARPVSEVMARLGMSASRFVRRFTDQVGITPKRYCRVRRFQAALRRIEGQAVVDWTDLALSCGYYDQAHFIHDFRAFSGLTPTAYLARRGPNLNHVPFDE